MSLMPSIYKLHNGHMTAAGSMFDRVAAPYLFALPGLECGHFPMDWAPVMY